MLARHIVMVVPFLLAGCLSLDPHYTRPAALVPASLAEGGAYASLGHGPGSNYRDIGWWGYILDAQLRQTVALALDSSRDLHEAVADVKAARAQYGEQRSDLFPTINAELTQSRSRALTGEGNQTAISHSAEANASVSAFELDLFGENQSLTREQYETCAVPG